MPVQNNNIVDLVITVTLQTNPVFNVQAGDGVTQPGLLPYGCNGFGQVNADLLKEILGKIITAYPSEPISLCIRDPKADPVIIRDAQCAGGGAAAAPARPAPAADAPRGVAKAAPKTGRRGRSPKKPT
jgi:hypothetical protein